MINSKQYLIYRQLVYEPFRTLLTSVAIASALAVILLLEGFQTGLLVQLKNVSMSRGADLIVAFTAYSLIARKRQELAVAKALGFSNAQIYLAALCQSLVITGLGLFLALLIAYTLIAWLPTIAPQVNVAVRLHQFIPLAVMALPVAVLASIGAARTVVKVDPLTVFNG